MNINRRDLLVGLAAAAVFPKLPAPPMAARQEPASAASVGALPRKSDFDIPEGLTYINAAYTHPTFVVKDRRPVLDRLIKANINVRLGQHFIRLSPSVYNDLKDIDRLLEALS